MGGLTPNSSKSALLSSFSVADAFFLLRGKETPKDLKFKKNEVPSSPALAFQNIFGLALVSGFVSNTEAGNLLRSTIHYRFHHHT